MHRHVNSPKEIFFYLLPTNQLICSRFVLLQQAFRKYLGKRTNFSSVPTRESKQNESLPTLSSFCVCLFYIESHPCLTLLRHINFSRHICLAHPSKPPSRLKTRRYALSEPSATLDSRNLQYLPQRRAVIHVDELQPGARAISPIQAIRTFVATLQNSNSEPDDTLGNIFNYIHCFLHSVLFYISEVKSDAGNYNDLKLLILLILICPS